MTAGRRELGRQGLVTPALGVGCMGLTVFYGADTAAADGKAMVRHAIERGATLLDTSDAYGPFTNEEMVGHAIKGVREQVILSTKFGVERHAGQSDGLTAVGINGRPDFVRASLEGSLRRLKTDYIDLYIQHRLDPDTPIEETVGAMGELVAEGKVRYVALCEVGPSTIKRAHSTFPLTAVHAEYSLWHRDPEIEVLPLLAELGIGFLPYSPLGRGFLTGRIRSIDDLAADDWRRHSPRFEGSNFERNLRLVERVQEIVTEKGVTPAQLVLAWILHKGDAIVPIQGATRPQELDENLGALGVELTASDVRRIEAVAPIGAAAGAAWPEGHPGGVVDRG